MAESYVETLTGEIDRKETVDQYRAALEQLVEAKVAGREIEQPRPAEAAGAAVDLMEALRRSVEEAKRSRGTDARVAKRATAGAATPKKATGRKAAKQTAKKTTAKKAAATKTTSR